MSPFAASQDTARRAVAPPTAAAALALLLALPACAVDDPAAGPQGVPLAAAQSAAGQAAPGAAPVARRAKPGALVQVTARVPAAAPLPLGQTVVELVLQGAAGVQHVGLRYQAEGSLRVEPAAPAQVPLDAGHRASVQVPVTVLAPGVHYLHVFTEAQGRTAALSVRLDAGGTAQQRQKRKTAVQEEGGFVVLPAEERRRD